eukprot:gene10011-10165_t
MSGFADFSSGGTITAGGPHKGGRPSFNLDSFIQSPYDDPHVAYCLACNETAGYTLTSKGRCSCKPGFGDLNPTGTCDSCPGGYISMGGFKAQCVECQNVAWSNEDHTSCLCASGWYGTTNYYTKQATCNQCPGSRPVSPDGSKTAADCKSCLAGSKPNEIYSECVSVNTTNAPSPSPRTLEDLLAPSPSPSPTPPAPKLWNASTFANASRDWQFTTRATQNVSNPITDLIGGVMESVIMGKPIAKGIAQPGDLLYQVLTKPPPEMPKLPDLQKLGAGAAALGGLFGAVGNGSKLLNSLQKVTTGLANSNLRSGSPGQGNDLKNLVSTLSSLLGSTNNNNKVNSVAKPAPQQFTQVPAAPPKGAAVPTISTASKKPASVPTKPAGTKPQSAPKASGSGGSKPASANKKPSSL